ncbi:hypothetical protein JCM3774_000808 [Rhodotorula dairenensis]
MSTTDEEATTLFRRTDKSRLAAAGGSVHRSASKWLPPPPDSDSSSDIEFVGTSSAVKQRAGNDPKGKGKATEKAAHSATSGTARKGPTRKSRRASSRLSSSSFGSSSDEDARMPTSGQMLPSTTQIADSGATLRALARDKGWQGQSPPPRTKRRADAAPAPAPTRKRKQSDPTVDNSDMSDYGHRGGRDASTSTDQTTISDRSSSSLVKPRKTAAASTSAAAKNRATTKKIDASEPRVKPRRKRVSKAASPSLSPSPEIDLENLPPPPESFWGIDTSLSKVGTAVKKRKHGEATNRLKSLSEQRSLLVLPDDDDDDQPGDEIALADSDSSSSGEEAGYELTTVKSKREKEEALARLRAKRGKPSVEPAARVSTPRAEPRTAPARGDGKAKALPEPITAACPLCSLQVALDELEAHTNECLDGVGMDEDFDPTPAQPAAAPARAPVAEPSKMAFRPAGTSAAAHARNAAVRPPLVQLAAGGGTRADNLANALFPSSPVQKHAYTATAASTSRKHQSAAAFDGDDSAGGGVQYDEAEIFASSPAKNKGKGKGQGKSRAPARPDGYLTSDGYDELPEVDASLNGTFIDLCADEEDDVHTGPFRGPSRAAAAPGRRSDGRVGPINSKFEPGPPQDGSSPPRSSLYISSMSAAYIDGYTRLYAKPAPKGKKARTTDHGSNAGYDPDIDDSEAREFEALAPAPPKRAAGIGRGSRGGKRGGNRRGSWSWRGKARGRGGGKRS